MAQHVLHSICNVFWMQLDFDNYLHEKSIDFGDLCVCVESATIYAGALFLIYIIHVCKNLR